MPALLRRFGVAGVQIGGQFGLERRIQSLVKCSNLAGAIDDKQAGDAAHVVTAGRLGVLVDKNREGQSVLFGVPSRRAGIFIEANRQHLHTLGAAMAVEGLK